MFCNYPGCHKLADYIVETPDGFDKAACCRDLDGIVHRMTSGEHRNVTVTRVEEEE